MLRPFCLGIRYPQNWVIHLNRDWQGRRVHVVDRTPDPVREQPDQDVISRQPRAGGALVNGVDSLGSKKSLFSRYWWSRYSFDRDHRILPRRNIEHFH
jgi:hypothetical protein